MTWSARANSKWRLGAESLQFREFILERQRNKTGPKILGFVWRKISWAQAGTDSQRADPREQTQRQARGTRNPSPDSTRDHLFQRNVGPEIRGAQSNLHPIRPDSDEARKKSWSWVSSTNRANLTRLNLGEIRIQKNLGFVNLSISLPSYLLSFPSVLPPQIPTKSPLSPEKNWSLTPESG